LYRATSWSNGAATQAGRQGGVTERWRGDDPPSAGEKVPPDVARGGQATRSRKVEPAAGRVAETRGCKLSIRRCRTRRRGGTGASGASLKSTSAACAG
jgi:hypothetical protein